MLKNILTSNSVKAFFDEIITGDKYNNKIIPNRICSEKIDSKEYCLYTALDAIIKYHIIINDKELFEKYLSLLKSLLKKVKTHNEIKTGINKILVKTCASKLKINDLDKEENKKEIISYIYDKYIVNGYFYHSFPSIFKDYVSKNGLDSMNYYHALNELKVIDKILIKYNLPNVFSKPLDKKGCLAITDSFFMASFYATNSPIYLKELCTNTLNKITKKYKMDAYLLNDYKQCRENIEYVIKKKEMTSKEKKIILNFFDKEWKDLNINNSYPVVALIKRKTLNKNSLYNYNNIISKLDSCDIYQTAAKILDIKFNEEEINGKIDSNEIMLLDLPNLKKYYEVTEKSIEIEIEAEKEISSKNVNYESDFLDEYGSSTILALFGVLFITLGVVVTMIMIGK